MTLLVWASSQKSKIGKRSAYLLNKICCDTGKILNWKCKIKWKHWWKTGELLPQHKNPLFQMKVIYRITGLIARESESI